MKLFSLKADYMAVLLYSLYRVRQDANKASIAVDVASSLKVRVPFDKHLSCNEAVYLYLEHFSNSMTEESLEKVSS